MRAARLLGWVIAACTLPAWAQTDGAAVFRNHCAACHGAAGEGTAGLAPALAGTLAGSGEEARRYVSHLLLAGLSGRIVSQGQVFTGAMPPQAALSDDELAAVASHVLRDLNSGQAAPLTAADLAQVRAARPMSHKELRALRERVAQ